MAPRGVLNIIGKQSVDINQGVDRAKPEDQGAGDQGLMFGYASNETDVLMPAPICFSHRLVERQAEARKSGLLPWLRPDAKSQVTCRYEGGKVVGIDAVVLSTQHNPEVSYNDLRDGVMELIIKQVLPAELLHKDTQFHINPTGNFVIGGPVGDCGLTGRKIIVDSYGGMARHGGGAFSGKDPSKVDARRLRRPLRGEEHRRRRPRRALRDPGFTPSAWPSRPRSRSTPSAPARSATRRSCNWSASTSTCARTRSPRCSTCSTRCTSRPRPTATSAVIRSS